MYKARASSYIRRSISEPFTRAVSLAGAVSVSDRSMHRQLIDNEVSLLGEVAESPRYTLASDLKEVTGIFCSKISILFVFFPLAILSMVYDWGPLPTFAYNFLALIPLAGVLGTSTEELALHTGDVIGGLLNCTFGNAVEMIITVQSLRANLIPIVQGTLLGSILSNLLLVLGMSFFAGGTIHHIQKFNAQGAQCSTSLLLLASLAVICPTVTAHGPQPISAAQTLLLSRYIAVFISFTYILFLYFQLHTHLKQFKAESEDELEYAALSFWGALVVLILTTVLISFLSDALIGSVNGVINKFNLSPNFIGVILLPIVGNAAEHATAVTVAMKNKPDLTMSVAVGSSTQIAMFMVPFAVIAGWIMNVPMTLEFTTVSVVILVLSIIIVFGIVQDGESNWLEGVMLMTAYIIIACVFWFS